MFTSFLVALFSHLSASAEPRGPIEIATEYPLTETHLSLAPTSAGVIDPGVSELGLQFTWSSVSIYEGQRAVTDPSGEERILACREQDRPCYTVDAETRKVIGRYRLGLGSRSEATFSVPFLWRGGGILDAPIDDWHRFFGLPGGDRSKVEDDQFAIDGQDGDRSFSFDDHGYGFGNAVLGAKQELSSSEDRTTSIELLASLPTAKGSYGHKGVDVGTALLHERRGATLAAHFGSAAFLASDTTLYGVDYQRVHGEAFAVGEYIYSPALSFLIGLSGSSAIVRNVPHHPNYALYLDTGAKFDALGAEWSLLLRENPAPGSGTTDVTLLAGFTLRR